VVIAGRFATGDEEGEDPLAQFGLDAIDLTMKDIAAQRFHWPGDQAFSKTD